MWRKTSCKQATYVPPSPRLRANTRGDGVWGLGHADPARPGGYRVEARDALIVDVTVLGLVGGAHGGETPRVADSSAAGRWSCQPLASVLHAASDYRRGHLLASTAFWRPARSQLGCSNVRTRAQPVAARRSTARIHRCDRRIKSINRNRGERPRIKRWPISRPMKWRRQRTPSRT